jgi:hypothetical protein
MTEMTDQQIYERACRILKLAGPPRLMDFRAAMIVVDAAMFGIGCLEGEVREKIQKEIDSKKAEGV